MGEKGDALLRHFLHREASFAGCSIVVVQQEARSAAGGLALLYQDLWKVLVGVVLGCDSRVLGHHIQAHWSFRNPSFMI